MSDWMDKLERRMRGIPPRGRPGKKPPRRGKSEGGDPVPADPKPRPSLLTGGAEAPVE